MSDLKDYEKIAIGLRATMIAATQAQGDNPALINGISALKNSYDFEVQQGLATHHQILRKAADVLPLAARAIIDIANTAEARIDAANSEQSADTKSDSQTKGS